MSERTNSDLTDIFSKCILSFAMIVLLFISYLLSNICIKFIHDYDYIDVVDDNYTDMA